MTLHHRRMIAPVATGALVLAVIGATTLLGNAADDTQLGFSTTAAPLLQRSGPAGSTVASVSPYAASTAPDLSNVMAVVDGTAFDTTIWPNFQRYVAGCMMRQGYSYGTAPRYTTKNPAPTTVGAADGTSATVTSTVEPAMADMAPASAPSSIASYNGGYLTALRGQSTATASTDFRAYDGVTIVNAQSKAAPVGGCELEGRQAVTYPAQDAASRVNVDLQPLLDSTLMTPEAQTVNNAWSACMRTKGYTYDSFLDPPALFRVRADVLGDAGGTTSQWTALRAEEASTSTASSACASSSGVSTFITQRVQPAWTTFRTSHLADLNRAGGMTNARGDLL